MEKRDKEMSAAIGRDSNRDHYEEDAVERKPSQRKYTMPPEPPWAQEEGMRAITTVRITVISASAPGKQVLVASSAGPQDKGGSISG